MAAAGGAVAGQDDFSTYDEKFARVVERVPEFGGAYWDDAADAVTVWVTDGDRNTAERARTALAEMFTTPSRTGLARDRLVMRKAAHSFASFKSWSDRATPKVLALPGVVATDVDERRNRLVISVEDVGKRRDAVESTLAAAGVPREAVVIEESAPMRQQDNLQDRHRPVVGGLQLIWTADGVTGHLCTLGFNAARNGVNGFVTNSHCTGVRGAVDEGLFLQGNSLAHAIGKETADPAMFTGSGCPAGRLCRRSDASFGRYDVSEWTRGRIARPPFGTTAWNGTDVFTITSKALLGGAVMNKVGRTTGRTQGIHFQTCVNVNVDQTNVTMLCQELARYRSDPGDSGSPVFVPTSGNNVTLAGIHWGGNVDMAAFSSIGQIERELGILTVGP